MRQRSRDRLTVVFAGCVLMSLTVGCGHSFGQTAPDRVARENWSCLKRDDLWRDQKGQPIWLNSDELKDRTTASRPIERPGPLGRNNLKGSITLEVVIDQQGNVVCARGTKGHPFAIAAAIKSLRHWSFTPIVIAGEFKSAAGVLTLTYNFSEPIQGRADQKRVVEIEYICAGPRETNFSDESNDGIWLRLRNKTRRTLFIRTYPTLNTKDSCAHKAKPKVGIDYEVVEDKGHASEEKDIRKLPADRPVPGTYFVRKVKPDQSIVFSVAREHLVPNRAIYVNFWYGQTQAKQKIEELSRAYFYAFELPDRTARIVTRRKK